MILVQEILSTDFSRSLIKLMENNNSILEDTQHGILPTNCQHTSNKLPTKCHCPELLPMENTPSSVIDFVLCSGFTQSKVLVIFS